MDYGTLTLRIFKVLVNYDIVITADTEDAEYMCRKLYEEHQNGGLKENFEKPVLMTTDKDSLKFGGPKIGRPFILII